MFASLLSVALAVGAHVNSTADPCRRFEQPSPHGEAPRPVSDFDLATIADIGRADPHDSPSPFGLSPDGRWIAFLVRRGNPETNNYCQRLMLAPLDGAGDARELDRGGDLIRNLFQLRNLPAVRAGTAQVITPRWSPDGRTIAFLKRVDGQTGIWTVAPDGGGASPATHTDFEIEDFAWAPDGGGFVIAGRPQLAEANAAIDREARSGYLFDARFSPMMSDRPFPVGNYPTRYFRVDLNSGAIHEASAEEIALIDPAIDRRRPTGAGLFATDAAGNQAWTQKLRAGELLSPAALHVQWKSGRTASCESAACTHIGHIWWSGGGGTLYFLVREGWANSRTSFYRWRRDAPVPTMVLTTEDALVGCGLAGQALICAREGAAIPRRLVAIDVRSGRSRTIFDPNPGFARLRLGKVQRLRFRNAYGVACFADLVLPPTIKPGEKVPMVVVQYYSEGFLRGGTGDEVPIQVLAGRGFAVLSMQRAFDPPGTGGATSELDYRRRVRRDWIDRRSVQSALETAVKAAIATGSVDADRLGISGFSEGSSATQWALINSRIFKVASLGSCCEDKVALPLNGGIGYQAYLEEMGYPLFEKMDPRFWAPLSLVQNADRIEAPILIQQSDDEYEGGLDVMEAFRRRGNPIEMYVFKDEPHVKWQPAHRLAIYDRVVDWFSFWLQGIEDCAAPKRAQYRRWEAMRSAPALGGQCSRGDAARP